MYSKKQQHQKQFYDRGARGSPYQAGNIVSLHDPVVKKGHSRKFHRPWKGPFKVVKLLGSTTYRIQDCKNSRKRKVVHFNHLKPAYYQSAPESTPLPKATETDPSERINIMLNSSENDFDNDPDYIVYLPSREELPSQDVQLRRSSRLRRPPLRYGDPISIPDSVTAPILEDPDS